MLRIAIPIYPGVDLIDATVTYDALSRIPQFSGYGLELDLVAATLDPIATGQRLVLTPTKTFADYTEPLDVLLVPGATDTGGATGDCVFMDFVTAQGATAGIVASVCTGALILATAKLLDGYQATTYWYSLDRRTLGTISPAVQQVNGYPRWVHDRNRLTGGGVSSSLDATLYLISLITDQQTAKCIQLSIQYNPQPPFNTGDPAVADYETYRRVTG